MSDLDDRRRVQRAALSIGLYVAVASAIVIAAGAGILLAVILVSRRPESAEHGGGFPHEGSGDDFVIDADKILPWVIVLGLLGVMMLALVAWLAARRSVRPLGDALRLQRNFVADASHELRTPLTTLTSRIQVLQRRHERGEPIEETIVELRRDAGMMTDVLGDLLLAAEGGAVAGDPASVDEAVRTAVESLRPLADEAGVTLAVHVRQSAAVALPTVTLVRLVVALVDNAVQYSPSGAAVTVPPRSRTVLPRSVLPTTDQASTASPPTPSSSASPVRPRAVGAAASGSACRSSAMSRSGRVAAWRSRARRVPERRSCFACPSPAELSRAPNRRRPHRPMCRRASG